MQDFLVLYASGHEAHSTLTLYSSCFRWRPGLRLLLQLAWGLPPPSISGLWQVPADVGRQSHAYPFAETPLGILDEPCQETAGLLYCWLPQMWHRAIYRYLALYPRTADPAFKESRFLWGLIGLGLSALRYRSILSMWWECPPGHLTFDADCTVATALRLAAALFHRLTPKAKIIISYRDPVEAAWSMYKFRSHIKRHFDFGWTSDRMLRWRWTWTLTCLRPLSHALGARTCCSALHPVVCFGSSVHCLEIPLSAQFQASPYP